MEHNGVHWLFNERDFECATFKVYLHRSIRYTYLVEKNNTRNRELYENSKTFIITSITYNNLN